MNTLCLQRAEGRKKKGCGGGSRKEERWRRGTSVANN